MTPTQQRPKALLIDDDPIVLRLLPCALQARGFEVLAARDRASGLGLLLDEILDLDVLVLDLDLPARAGWALLNLVRGAGGERDLGIVILASGLDRPRRAQLHGLGADAVVDRSAGPEAVTRAVAQAAAARRARSAHAPARRGGALGWLAPEPKAQLRPAFGA
jgi:CheY-like chemotaxis protein